MSKITGCELHPSVHGLICDPPKRDCTRFWRNPIYGTCTAFPANQSALRLHNPLILTSFRAKISNKAHSMLCMVPHAVLVSGPSELVQRFMLGETSELQVNICVSNPGCLSQIDIQITNNNDSAILHWGALRGRDKTWVLPSNRPNGTKVYKNKALRSPFMKVDSNLFLKLEIDDPDLQAIEFLIFDETKNKWLKNNDQNFHIQLFRQGMTTADHLILSNHSVPEDLVQIQAFLQWERKGKHAYTPEQEKLEYEAARLELMEMVARGTSIEELRAKLTKSDDKQTVSPLAFHEKIPDDLVQIHAYIRWEKAGKPSYSQAQQMWEFEEARKELQAELGCGISVDDIRKKLTDGNTQKKVSKQLPTRTALEKIHRKRRDFNLMINKYVAESGKEKISGASKLLTVLELWSKTVEEQYHHVLGKRLFKLGHMELMVLAFSHSGKTKVCVATNLTEPLIFHWALSRRPLEWMVPKLSMLPPRTTFIGNAYETHFVSDSAERSYQHLEIEIDGGDFVGMPFVLRSNGTWIKNRGSDFYFEFGSETQTVRKDIGDVKGIAKTVLDRIADLETEAERSLMHRFNIAAGLLDEARGAGELGIVGILVWMRFMATRQLTWNKNYNVKPREISKAQDTFTSLLERVYTECPWYREFLRLIMSTVGRGGEGDTGQRIRDEILVIQRNNECKGGMMEEWHQKLHNNSSPDDIVICEALINYIRSDFNIDMYWNTLRSNGITKDRLLSYDRAIHSEPRFSSGQKEGLLRDLGHYLKTLKAVHSGADLESAIATCMGYTSVGEGFMVGVRIDPVSGLPSGFPELLQFILQHIEDKNITPLIEGLLEARVELRPLLLKPHDRLKDLIFLDIALDSTVRTVIERGYEELSIAGAEIIMYTISLVLENLALSSDDNEDLIYCLKGWDHAMELLMGGSNQWALLAKAVHDRTRLALLSKAEQYQNLMQPSANYLGSLLGVPQWAISIFTEEIIRGGSATSLSSLLNRLDPILRQKAHLGSWQIISPVEVVGYVKVVNELTSVQNETYSSPTILVTNYVKGEEEIPDGVVAVLTPDMPDILSHVSVRARNSKVCFATCFDNEILSDLQAREGQLLQLKTMPTNVLYNEVQDCELLHAGSPNVKGNQSSWSLVLDKKLFAGRFAVLAEEFTSEMVGAKSRNISYLRGKMPSWISIPSSVAIPFGVMEKVLSDDQNKAISEQVHYLKGRLTEGDLGALREIRKAVLELLPPPLLVQELRDKMRISGIPWPADDNEERWNQAWMAIKKVWASKWNERAYFSTRKVKLDHDSLCMAVLVQEIISADYAFVIHTTNPSSGDSSEIYAEVVKGLGETLVGAYPGRALSFICRKNDLNSPQVLGYPSKPVGLFIRRSIIFRSDSNGEDLEGYAGAGLYDSVPMDEEERVILDYTTDPLIIDGKFQISVLSSIAQAGLQIEKLYGSPQDVEGVVKDGKIFVVQTRPQM